MRQKQSAVFKPFLSFGQCFGLIYSPAHRVFVFLLQSVAGHGTSLGISHRRLSTSRLRFLSTFSIVFLVPFDARKKEHRETTDRRLLLWLIDRHLDGEDSIVSRANRRQTPPTLLFHEYIHGQCFFHSHQIAVYFSLSPPWKWSKTKTSRLRVWMCFSDAQKDFSELGVAPLTFTESISEGKRMAHW